MTSNADHFLKKTLGEDFFESLQKVELWKPGTRTTIDHEELRTALQIVPRTVMALLIRELIPMAIGETKEVHLFLPSNALLRVNKHERDVYSGDIEQDNKKVVDFKYRALPGIGLVIMSAFELYDMENLINTPTPIPTAESADLKIQKLIEERLSLHDLVNKVVDKRLLEKEAVNNLFLMKLTEELHKEKVKQEKNEEQKQKIVEITKIQEQSTPQSEEYFRGMTNGMKVIESVVTEKEPNFIEAKKQSPVKKFLESRKKKNEFSLSMAKGETVDCPDCGKNIFNGQVFSGCVCLGDDMDRRVFIKKTEDGIKVRFSKGWDIENIEMLLETLKKRRACG